MNQTLPTLIDITDNTEWLRARGSRLFELFQGQLTINMNTVNSSNSRFAAHCSPQGKVITSFRIFQYQNDYLLKLPVGMSEVTKQALNKYAMLFQAELQSLDDWQSLGIYGIEHNHLILDYLPRLPERVNEVVIDGGLIVVRIDEAPSRYEIHGQASAIAELKAKISQYCNTQSADSWKLMDVNQKHAPVYPQTSSLLIPHRLGYQHIGALDWDKGCYTGQEVIARTQYRSNKNFLLQTMSASESMAPGDKIKDTEDQQSYTVLECVSNGENWQLLVTS